MTAYEATSPKVLLYGLEDSLLHEISQVLRNLPVTISQFLTTSKPNLVFCALDAAVLEEARSLFPGTPVVVCSRFPDVSAWLDALEAGAADYCAAPFETSQLEWILSTHLRVAVQRTAAAA